MYNAAHIAEMIARHAATEQNAGTIRLRRATRTVQADNSTKATGWTTPAGCEVIEALIQIETSAVEGGVGEQAPVTRGGLVFVGGPPLVGDGVQVLTGEHAGLTFRITDVVSLVGTSFECAVIATPESYT